MFLENEYTSEYFNICNNAKKRLLKEEYFEEHWIIPLVMGGSETDENNIARLLPSEHFLCHQLLVEMVEEEKLRAHMAFMLERLKHDCPSGKNRGVILNSAPEYSEHQIRKNTIFSNWKKFDNEMDKYRQIEKVEAVGNPPPRKVFKPVNGKLTLQE